MSRYPDIAISKLILVVMALALALSAAPARAQEGEDSSSEKAHREDILGLGPYIRFATIVVPIIQGDKVAKQISLTLTLQLFESKSRAEVDAKRPLLIDAFVKYLYVYFQQRAGLKTPLNEAVLKDRLRQTAADILGPDVVKEVLIQQLLER